MPSNNLLCRPFSSCLQSFPASGSFPVIQLVASGGQGVGALALASILPMTLQGWFASGLTGLIFLLSKGLSRAFPSTTILKYQFFGTQLSLWFNFAHKSLYSQSYGFSSSYVRMWELDHKEEPPYDPATPLMVIHLNRQRKDICTPMFIKKEKKIKLTPHLPPKPSPSLFSPLSKAQLNPLPLLPIRFLPWKLPI